MKELFILLCVCISSLVYAQDDILVDEIIISDIRNVDDNDTAITLKDSLLTANTSTLTELLSLNSSIHFKEGGLGMISSPAFRGTTASQTTVLWNGININSKFLGQTNFNTITTSTFNEVKVKSGGSSLLNGSGAIGGPVHLSNKLQFGKGLNGTLQLGIGDFSTLKTSLRTNYSTPKESFSISFTRLDAHNDYEIKSKRFKNINGQLENQTINFASGFILNANNSLSFFYENHQDETHFALITPFATKTKYQNDNSRALLKYDNQFNIISSTVRVAYLIDNWTYFSNISAPASSGGKAKTLDLKYDGKVEISNHSLLSVIGEHTNTVGNGFNTGIKGAHQTNSAFGLFYQFTPSRLLINLGVRKDFNKDYKSPYLYSAKAKYKISKYYTIGLKTSKHFRAPTFNDLYWVPGGNLNLKAEHAIEYEINQKISFKNINLRVNAFVNNVDNMIRWTPTDKGYWSPANVDKAEIKGLELILDLQKSINKHIFNVSSSYAYTDSKNKDTANQFVYVPRHNWNTSLHYNYGRYSGNISTKTVGPVYTLNDNTVSLDGYTLVNLSAAMTHRDYTFTLNAKNIFDKIYESVENRPMPLRNYSMTINLNF